MDESKMGGGGYFPIYSTGSCFRKFSNNFLIIDRCLGQSWWKSEELLQEVYTTQHKGRTKRWTIQTDQTGKHRLGYVLLFWGFFLGEGGSTVRNGVIYSQYDTVNVWSCSKGDGDR